MELCLVWETIRQKFTIQYNNNIKDFAIIIRASYLTIDYILIFYYSITYTCGLIMSSEFWKTHEDSEYIPCNSLKSLISHMEPGIIVHTGLSSLYLAVGLKAPKHTKRWF